MSAREFLRELRLLREDAEQARESRYRDGYLDALDEVYRLAENMLYDVALQEDDDHAETEEGL